MDLHNHTLASAVNGKASKLDSVASRDGAHQWGFTHNLDELLAGVSVLVQLADIS